MDKSHVIFAICLGFLATLAFVLVDARDWERLFEQWYAAVRLRAYGEALARLAATTPQPPVQAPLHPI